MEGILGPGDSGALRNNPPYNAGAFRFELTFPTGYPMAPPRATLLTPIYHPGVDPQGEVCQPLTDPQLWAPTTRAINVLRDLLRLLDHPDQRRVLQPQLARELQDQPEVFQRRAEKHTRRHAEPRQGPPGTPGP
ncbi:LOW QUALITY PROTEIN: ubiquitin-conjugating enzyme E2-18 kDa-like [Apus apus]|uniref:LOW QUALITY PROTEIN: ubiquitin-conjugating enzyme E2-18 kDa-like n=1 Tax=Apus apus TaxID=8895 RepID=UPI0021F8F890|nr:LOW QUALITY PROTEIN: ubiquitin-conjugating enzyme E2-18 kDa-like [Apus apus]